MVSELTDLLVERMRVVDTDAPLEALAPHRHQFRLAAEVMGSEEGEESAPLEGMAPERPNPVTQSEMAAGSVELF